MLKNIVAGLFLLVLFGCGPSWVRPNTTQQQTDRDEQLCEVEAAQINGPNNIGAAFDIVRCMRSKGYK